MRKLFTFFAFVMTLTTALAVPAHRGITRTVRTNDGKEIKIGLRGDENFHFYVNVATGTPMREQADGTWTEDTRDINATWKAAIVRRKYNRQRLAERTRRMAKAPSRVGSSTLSGDTKKGLLILVNFKDIKLDKKSTKAVYEQMLNGLNNPYGNNNGSVREYFRAQSYGQFDVEFDVAGPVTVSQKMAYYGGNDSSGNDQAAEEMIVEACKLVNNQVDFKTYDWDGDGEVENIYVTYAGFGENYSGVSSDAIWPHQWDLASAGLSLTLDGVIINTYACGAELDGNSGTTLSGIGTMCHEYSHCLGLPDFYVTNNDDHPDMMDWSLMASGSYNGGGFCPAGYTAYERWFCGWLEPTELNEGCVVSNLKPIEEEPAAYVVYNDANPNEYYLLANHQKKGWDKKAAGHGMMVLHVDYDKDAWYDNTVNNSSSHQRMIVIPADNEFAYDSYNEMYYSDGGDLYPGTSNNTSLTNASIPSAKLYNNNTDGRKLMNKPIKDITEENGLISFKFMGGTPLIDAPLATDATDVKPTAFTANWRPVEDAISYNLSLTETYDDGQEEEESYLSTMNLYEDFKKFMVSSDGSEDISSKLDDYTFVSGWTGSKVFKGIKGAKLASSKADGFLTTPLLDFNSGTMTVIMTVCNYNSDNASPKLICLDEDGEELLDYDIHPAENTYFSFTLSGGAPSKMKLKISTSTGKRIYVGDMYVFDTILTSEQFSDFLNNELKSPSYSYQQTSKSIGNSAPRKAQMVNSQFFEGLTGNSFTVTGCKPNATYTYKIQALDADGNVSNWSNVITVETPVPQQGDVNMDGVVGIADVTSLVNIILGKASDASESNVADVNGDGSVGIADVTALVNIILGKQPKTTEP